MALINCPECNREISDKVKACPHCGYPLQESIEDNESMQKVEISSVKIQSKDPAKTKKIITGIGVIAVIAIIAFVAFLLINAIKEKEAFNTYIDNLYDIRILMLGGGSKGESLNNITAKVWRNSIYEESDSETDKFTKDSRGNFHDDFNVALSALHFDSSTQRKITEIEDNQKTVQEKMKELQNLPEGLENCYQTATDMYTAYRGLTDLAINPTGSFQSFSTAKNEKVDAFLDFYKRLETQIPDKK